MTPPPPDSRPIQYPLRPALAVGAVVFKDNRVLLVKRGNPPARGVWAIPGGSVELGETLQKAAEREVLEETGIVIKAGEPVLSFESIHRDDNDRVRFHYYIVDLAATYISGEPSPGDDALDAGWISGEALGRLNVNPITLKLLRQTFNFG
ncbi:NUDIX hydrolase [Desulfobacter postgatei]|uniref:NUDIX hydrolase n=1 Tax=Desulfobacter postgatei TaxID=2293 RepID=UPI002A36D86A|nr:NUDIX hydrolase [Desulfobacter postgatei]MDX9962642.1 NUDIX hydrolase [Desulfobacter postgatei]